MRTWCVIVDDPNAFRGHIVCVQADTAKEAERIAAIAASHADLGLVDVMERLAPWGPELQPKFGPWPAERFANRARTSAAEYAIAFPMDGFVLDRDSDDWPRVEAGTPGGVAGQRIEFVIREGYLVAYDPLKVETASKE